jgi:hypothetical protein
MEGDGQLVHSFLSEHPASLKLRKKDIRVMEWGDRCYSLELSLTLATLVRHQNNTCTVCPTSLNAHLKTSFNVVKRAPDTGRPVHLSPRLWRIAGLTTSQSTRTIGHLRFGSWLLFPARTPPAILTLGVQLDLEVHLQFPGLSAADHPRPFITSSICMVLRTFEDGPYNTGPGLYVWNLELC